MIGVYIPVLKGTFYTPILGAIDSELRATGRHMVVAFGCGDGDARQQAIEGIEFLIERGCDGLVVMSNALLDSDIDALGPKRNRLVVLNHNFASIADQCFTADHTRGGTLAAQALLQMQHRHFAVISGPATSPDNVARIAGFMRELKRNGVEASQVRTFEGDFSPESGWAAARALLACGHKFTALFCANDEMAVGALSHFQQAGLSVPTAASVLGYDDSHSAEYSAPPLSSVHIPWNDITLNGLRWLLNQCYGETQPVLGKFPVSVTWRASVVQAPGTVAPKTPLRKVPARAKS
jgi:LacI family transcriptional regulator